MRSLYIGPGLPTMHSLSRGRRSLRRKGSRVAGLKRVEVWDFDPLPRIKRINKIKFYGPYQEAFARWRQR